MTLTFQVWGLTKRIANRVVTTKKPYGLVFLSRAMFLPHRRLHAFSESEAWQKLLELTSSGTKLEELKIRRKYTVDLTRLYLQRAGVNWNALPPTVHITGTKGKGSTAVTVDACLRAHGYRTLLFTSPHLVDVRERFRINGEPIDKSLYLQYFTEVYEQLQKYPNDTTHTMFPFTIHSMPGYFNFLTILCFHIAQSLPIDCLILEVGVGGLEDATNAIGTRSLCASGVATIDIDHTDVLGSTLASIATHKGGIFRTNVPAVTVQQRDEAKQALLSVAIQRHAPLFIVTPESIAQRTVSNAFPALSLLGDFQKHNSALALALSSIALREIELRKHISESADVPARGQRQTPPTQNIDKQAHELNAKGVLPDWFAYHNIQTIPQTLLDALQQVNWPGRSQKLLIPPNKYFFIDGAHTPLSMECASEWYSKECSSLLSSKNDSSVLKPLQCLFFSCHVEKDPIRLMLPLLRIPFDHVFFIPLPGGRPSHVPYPTAANILDQFLTSLESKRSTGTQCDESLWAYISGNLRTFINSSADAELGGATFHDTAMDSTHSNRGEGNNVPDFSLKNQERQSSRTSAQLWANTLMQLWSFLSNQKDLVPILLQFDNNAPASHLPALPTFAGCADTVADTCTSAIVPSNHLVSRSTSQSVVHQAASLREALEELDSIMKAKASESIEVQHQPSLNGVTLNPSTLLTTCIFITGSLSLVGDALRVLDSK